jgi:ribosomal protein L16 Arg81 hydroxylase
VDTDRYPLFARACLMDVVLEPGDALFLPAGWWHWVRSLSTSISATFSSFAIPGGNVRMRRIAPTPS